ncbi:exocyst protein [Coprinellus micaceus]|uniref:Exocyst protein n=1 Tax=Coprinellus micaceus TaxID=71717 RepID=A0A4Y7TZH2_COPMI|nr:exocyst protein [Coprinellus micaceus]
MDIEEQRQKIISSVFSRRDEVYVGHIKIWEDAGPEGGGRKPRYILISQSTNGTGYMHKSKLNTNGSYSVGKTWRISELRGLQVLNPRSFNITLSRTYRWETESRELQASFLQTLVQLFRNVTGGAAPLQLEGVPELDRAETPTQRAGPPSAAPVASSSRAPPTNQYEETRRNPSPAPSQSRRNGVVPSPAPAPGNRERTASSRSRETPSKNRPPSIQVPLPDGLAPTPRPQGRRPSNAASTTSQAPSVASQAPPGRPLPVANSVSRDSQNSREPREASMASDYPARSSRAASPAPPGPPRVQPTRSQAAHTEASVPSRRDQNVRISYFDPSNQAMLDRVLTNVTDSQIDVDGEEEQALATLKNVEEMIEGYEWASEDVIGRKSGKGAIDLIEARLLDELTALEKANVHSFLETDDRIALVMKFMDEAINELDAMDGLISSYKIHLNAVSDDILFIQGQNRGLQVQTQNQRALLGEIQNLLRTVHVDQDVLVTLTQESLEKSQSITRLEEASSELYKALQAGRDTDMAATMERLQDYKTHNSQFCKRIFDFLSIMFIAQSKLLLGDHNGLTNSAQGAALIVHHDDIEKYLGRYAGLMLYLKEMDEAVYGKLCAAYFSSMSDLHQAQITALLASYLNLVKKGEEDEQDSGFGGSTVPGSKAGAGMRRAGTLIRSPLEGRGKDKDKAVRGDQRASEVFVLVLEQVQTSIYRENEFITDFLQINDAGLTFADYMGMESYFRRQAARSAGLSQTTVKLIRGAMDLIFGFLPAEVKAWVENAVAKDNIEIIGIIGTIERAIGDAEKKNNPFFLNLLDKQHTRLKSMFDRYIAGQLKQIEQTKLTSKKRRGVAPFIKYFSSYVSRVENQLVGAGGLEVRSLVDAGYERIVKGMFDALKHMAKMEGEGEDKGQLNYHVILIENMHYFVNEMLKLEMGSTQAFAENAQAIYEDNLDAYVRLIFRRPLAKLMDFFEAVERLGPDSTNLSSVSTYNKSALKKVLKEFNAKDMRKHIEGLHKRVEKHFTDASEKSANDDLVFSNVWKGCEAELVKLTEKIGSLISQYYGDSGVSLEFTRADIESAFKKTRAGM